MSEQIKQHIERLRDELNRHNYNYYVLNAAGNIRPRFRHDEKEIEKLEQEHPEYADPLSPTQRVGSDINKAFTQHVHQRPMLSLGNTYSIEEVDDFVNRTRDALMGENFTIVGRNEI